MMHHVELN